MYDLFVIRKYNLVCGRINSDKVTCIIIIKNIIQTTQTYGTLILLSGVNDF